MKQASAWRAPSARPAFALALALLLLLTAHLAAPPQAGAVRGLTTALYTPSYRSGDEAERDHWFNTTVEARAGIVRINLNWEGIAGPQPPADPRSPSDPSYSFGSVDRAVREAAERGLDVYLTIYQAPPWAEGPDRPAITDPALLGPGAWKPDPGALGDFATALATLYSGSFPDPATGQPLPHVRYYEAWNEPNIPQYLAPQYEGGAPTGVNIYRDLLAAVAAAVKGVDKGNQVIGPALAPYGDPPAHAYRSRPFDFVRNLFCLKGGKKPKPQRQCSKKQIPTLDIFSAHPINSYGGPADEAEVQGDAASGDLDELVKYLRAAEKAKNIRPRGKRPVWVTEFWWITTPVEGTTLVVDLPTQARYVAQSLYLHWKAGAQVSTYFGLDTSHYGLFNPDGTPKPAFEAFRFPFVVDRGKKGKLLAWGKAPGAGQLEIQREGPNGWETIKQLAVKAGVFMTQFKLEGSANLRAVIGSDASLPWGV